MIDPIWQMIKISVRRVYLDVFQSPYEKKLIICHVESIMLGHLVYSHLKITAEVYESIADTANTDEVHENCDAFSFSKIFWYVSSLDGVISTKGD